MHYYLDVLKQYIAFHGKATRKEFWMFTLWNVIFSIVVIIVESILMRATGISAFMVLLWIYAIAVFLPVLGVSLRRLHDAGFNGWWILVDLIPFIGPIILIIMLVQPTKGIGDATPHSTQSTSPPDTSTSPTSEPEQKPESESESSQHPSSSSNA